MDKMRAAALAIAVTAWGAVGLQSALSTLAPMTGNGGLPGLIGLFGYFTIWSNVLVALVMTAVARHGLDAGWLSRRGTVAALSVYIIIVGAVYNLILASQWHPVGLHKLGDTLLHTVTPLAVPLFWLALVPHGGLRAGQALAWLGFPAGYLGFAMARGALTGKYAYPFLDLTKLDGATVTRNIVLLFALFVVLALAVIALDRGLGRLSRQTRIQPGE